MPAPVSPPPNIGDRVSGEPPTTGGTPRNWFGLASLIVSVIALLAAMSSSSTTSAWVVAILGIILGIVGYTKTELPRRSAGIGTVLGAFALVVSLVIAPIITEANRAADVAGPSTPEPTIPTPFPSLIVPTFTVPTSVPFPSTPTPIPPVEIGGSATNASGVTVTMKSLDCGIKRVGEGFLEKKAVGQYCRVKFRVDNDSAKATTVFSGNVTGLIGEAEYETETVLSSIGEGYFSAQVNPGLAVSATVYLDIPKKAKLDFVQYSSVSDYPPSPLLFTV